MKRTLIAVVAVLGFATAANAASIAISTDAATYNVGDTITVTVDLTVNAGESASDAALTLGYDSALVGNASVDVGVDQLTSFGNSGWSVSALQGQCDQPELCRVVGQLGPNPGGSPADAYASQAVLTFSADAQGFATFDFPVENFFGASGGSVTVEIVPEPTTAALLGLGLFGLALGGRRRS